MKHPRNDNLKAFLQSAADEGAYHIWLEPDAAYLGKAEWAGGEGYIVPAEPWTPEPHFSKSPCDCCAEPLAGNRYSAAIKGRAFWGDWNNGEIDVCEDCYAFFSSEGIVRTTTHMTLTVYEVSRCWGGAEEGGWWYDWYNLPCLEAAAEYLGKERRRARLHIEVPIRVLENWRLRVAVEIALKARARRVGYIFDGDDIETDYGTRKARSICSSSPEANVRLCWEHRHGQHRSSERPLYS